MLFDKSTALNSAERRISTPIMGGSSAIRLGLASNSSVIKAVPISPTLIKKPIIAKLPLISKPAAVAVTEETVVPAIESIDLPVVKSTPEPVEAISLVEEIAAESVAEQTPELVLLEEPVMEDPAVEQVTTITEEPAEAGEKAAEVEAPKRRRRSTSRSTDESQDSDSGKMIVDMLELPHSTADVTTAVSTLFPRMIDKEWDEFEKEVRDELASIQALITPDMTPGGVRYAVAEINELLLKITRSYFQVKTIYENLISRDKFPGDIERRILMGSVGNNAEERKKNGIMAAANIMADDGKSVINMFEVANEFRLRYNFLQSVMDFLKRSSDQLISVNASLKLDASTM